MASLLNKIFARGGNSLVNRSLTTLGVQFAARLVEPAPSAFPWVAQRNYRMHPTHNIGHYRSMLKKLQVKGRKAKLKPDPIWTTSSPLVYSTLNVQLSGHDVTVVEHYTRYVHRLCNRLGVRVLDSYALPTRTTDVLLLDRGTKMVPEASLPMHARVVQIVKLRSTLAPVMAEVLQLNQPEGVALDISEHTEEDYKRRLKERPQLEQLQSQVKGRRDE